MSEFGRLQSLWAQVRGTPAVEQSRFRGPPDTRLYAVGDIHGRLDLLTAMQTMIERDAASSRARRRVVIYLGDYIDRGPDSRGVLDGVARSLEGFERVCLIGNHEREMLAVLDGEREADHWLQFGGLATLRSYGVGVERVSAKPGEIRRILQEVVPAAQQAFLHALQQRHREGDILFVHAGIRPGVALDAQDPEDLVWIRDPFLKSGADHGCLVVHGHTIVSAPEIRPNRVGIDTGAYASGQLTCLVVEGGSLSFLNT